MGPLAGIRIIEIAGIGPGPMCAMLLADLGAEIICVDRPGGTLIGLPVAREHDFVARGRRSIALDLKMPEAVEVLLRLVEKADGLIEGFRPGVVERLGFGPQICLARNPKLVFGRMTGFGQSGPLAEVAGHDINYIALAGALSAIGRKGEKPLPPLNLVGDYAGGALYLAIGMLAGLLNARATGQGDVIDAAMVDGVASLMAMFCSLRASGVWRAERGDNILDSGAPWYDTYQTADGLYVAVGAIEPKFFQAFAKIVELDTEDIDRQHDRSHWPALREKLTAIFLRRSRAEWTALFERSEACVAPVLDLAEAALHPHLVSRKTFVEAGGFIQPAPAPRFANAQCEMPDPPPEIGADTDAILAECGYGADESAALKASGAATG
ncbi:CaiB/BaiF CoA transferase family protein [Rhodoblastus sp.]|uniref:CaiB/BaiF CoA transferase family protein n=1 Tax=Rhodoblastus sp. TaxID=1962975 RepID=UPI003F9A1EF2